MIVDTLKVLSNMKKHFFILHNMQKSIQGEYSVVERERNIRYAKLIKLDLSFFIKLIPLLTQSVAADLYVINTKVSDVCKVR